MTSSNPALVPRPDYCYGYVSSFKFVLFFLNNLVYNSSVIANGIKIPFAAPPGGCARFFGKANIIRSKKNGAGNVMKGICMAFHISIS